jgi:hypothetical protein
MKAIFFFLLAFFRNIFSRKFYMYDEILSGIHHAERWGRVEWGQIRGPAAHLGCTNGPFVHRF